MLKNRTNRTEQSKKVIAVFKKFSVGLNFPILLLMKNFLSPMVLLLVGFLVLESCNTANKNNTMEQIANQNKTNLLIALAENNTEAVAKILEKNPDLELKDNEGRTPLMIAAYNEANNIAAMLISAGANVNTQDNRQNSPFLYAGAEGNVELLNLGLKNAADFKIFNRYGGTALIPAAEKGHLEIVKILTKVPDFPINHINKLGWTALLEAVILSKKSATQTAIVKTLVEAGANLNIADKDGVTTLQHAKNKSLKEIVAILINAGAK